MEFHDRGFERIRPDEEQISMYVKFGENVKIGWGVVIDENVEIGDNVFIGHNTVIRSNVSTLRFRANVTLPNMQQSPIMFLWGQWPCASIRKIFLTVGDLSRGYRDRP